MLVLWMNDLLPRGPEKRHRELVSGREQKVRNHTESLVIFSHTRLNSRPSTKLGRVMSSRPNTRIGSVMSRPRNERGVISPYPTVLIA